jgi:50S ribosomal protein L16 3-hydroxylase
LLATIRERAAIDIRWPDGLTTQTFLDQYWQRQPLLIRAAFADFNNPLDADELAGLACDDDASARFIEQQADGQWRMCHGPLDDDFFASVSGNRWSILVSDVEKLLPDFQTWLQPFRFIPDWRIDDLMISYAPVGGSVGAHVDQYDVFLLQADGVREWQIEDHPRPAINQGTGSAISLLSDFKADRTFQLEAGDMLYLPPGFAHHGIAVAEPCMTWSIGFRAPSAAELIPALIHNLCETPAAQMRFVDPARASSTHPGRIEAEDLRQLRDLIRATLAADDQTLDGWIGRALSSGSDPNPEDEPAPVANSGASLVPHSYKHFLYMQHDDHTRLFVDGEMFDCSASLAQAICDRQLLPVELIEDASEADRELIDTLAARELLVPCDDRQH